MSYSRWTTKEVTYLVNNYYKLGMRQTAANLNRTLSSINIKRQRLGLLKRLTYLELGSRFGDLTVIELDKKTHSRRTYYKCLCDCGTYKSVYAVYLRNGDTKSCGCRRTDPNKKLSKKDDGFCTLNNKFCKYKKSAFRRNLQWNLSFDQFREITSKNCFYCGIEPKLVNYYFRTNGQLDKRSKPYLLGRYNRHWVKFNGIDRVNSKQGYEIINVVPCCSKCNFIKNDTDFNDFINRIKLISSRF